jgi:poly(3-hydroxybutyrate) depolymerase
MRKFSLTVTLCLISSTTLFAQDPILAKFVARSHSVHNGIFLSTNSGTSWRAVNNGLPANYSVLACAISGTYLFAGTNGGGVFRSSDNGTSWSAANTGLTNTNVRAFALIGANLFAGTDGGGVFLSTDNGTSWSEVSAGLTNIRVSAFAVKGTNLFAGTLGGGVFLSTDNGTSWTTVKTGLTNRNVHALMISDTNIFAGTDGGIFLSTNNGTSWSAASTGLTNRYVYALAVTPASGGTDSTNLFAATNGGGVFRSTDNGTSWSAVSAGMTSTRVWAFAVSGTYLFAGTIGGGVFLSTDNGTSWSAGSTGLTNRPVYALSVSGTNLFAGTDVGVTLPYRLFIPADYSPSQKYPIMLALHGAGETGTDNIKQLSYEMAISWAKPVNQAMYPCFVVVPQCPTSLDWGNDQIIATNVDLMDSLIREFTIDTNRLYITGLSLGGGGTWDMITRFPNRFAAAIPMSGGGNPALVSNIASTSIWDFHGAQDATIPVAGSRNMMEALKGIGRTVVYTHCHNNDCSGLPDSTIAMYVKSHADLFYTEYQYGGHNIWNESYDYPLLVPWVFDKYRSIPGVITITNLRHHRTLKGIEAVNWQSSVGGDSVEIWYSPDAGRTWRVVSRSEPNSGTYQWDTQNFKDGAFELLKVYVKNHEGFIFGKDQSSYFAVDNAINGTPFVKILNEEFTTGRIFNLDTLTLKLLVGDSKIVPLTVRLYYSPDGGQNFIQFDSYTTMADTLSTARLIHLGPLENSIDAVIKVEVEDGKSSSSDQTYPFIKQPPTSVAEKTSVELPKHFALAQNYPNPFNPSTVISYQLPVSSYVTLKVYDLLGREVATLVNDRKDAGSHKVSFHGSSLSSGMYVYQLQAEDFRAVRKMVLTK